MSTERTPSAPPTPLPASGTSVAALVLGITSIVFCWWGLATLAQFALAIYFGIKNIKLADQGLAGGKGLATAGLMCGIVGGILYLIIGITSLGIGFII